MKLWPSVAQTILAACCPRRQKKRLLRWFIDRRADEPFLFRGSYGLVYLVQARNSIDAEILRFGIHEKNDIELILAHVRKNKPDMMIDIGANLGAFALAVASQTDCPRIVAFEPDPLNRAKLYANIFLNGLTGRIDVRNEALSNESRRASFYAARADNDINDNTGASSLEAGHHAGLVQSIEVQTARLDDILGPLAGRTLAVKMDIEGHEAMALAGMANIIKNNRVWLHIEIMPRYAERTRAALQTLGLAAQPNGGSQVNFIFASPDNA